MLLTYSSAVIGLVTLTVIGTVLPFSTSGGTSSLTLPVRTGASPTTLRMAEASIAGVPSAGRNVTIGTVPNNAAPPARPRKRRRVDGSKSCMMGQTLLIAQRCKIRHNILDLLRRQDRLAAPARTHVIQAVDAIIGRHDSCGIEVRRVDKSEPKLADGRAAAGAGKARRKIALELGFRKRPGVTENAGAGAIQHQGPPARRVAGSARQRIRNAVADDRVGCERLRASRAGQGERGSHKPRHMGDSSSQRHPP